MLKKTIKYMDYNGVEREEDLYFNLNKAELLEMELKTTGGLAETIRKLISTRDIPSIAELFKEIILKSYGEKSSDGKRFIKSKELSEAFSQTEAYAELFTELATDEIKAAEFVNGIVPRDLVEKAQQLQIE